MHGAHVRGPMRWQELAKCKGKDLEIFFPGHGEDASEAKSICASCPVRVQCLDEGMNHRFGVWGGTSERQRRRMRRGSQRDEPNHGTTAMYHRGCTCDECRYANNRAKRIWRENRVI